MSIARWLPKLRPVLEPICRAHSVPLGVAIGWIEKESGGNIAEITNLGERGLFQLDPDEALRVGAAPAALSTDPVVSCEAGLKLIDGYRATVQAQVKSGISDGTEYLFRLIKLAHTMGAGSVRLIAREAEKAGRAKTWADLARYAVENDAFFFNKLKHRPSKWMPFIDELFALGRPFGVGTPDGISLVAVAGPVCTPDDPTDGGGGRAA